MKNADSGYTKRLSLFEHERIQKVRRLNTKQLVDDEALADTFLYMKKRIQEETDRFRSAKSNRANLPKTGNTSKLAKFNDVGSDGPSSIDTTPVKQENTAVLDVSEQLSDDDFEDIEGY
ncbi:hypothetical protein VTH8203_02400 [Vibrio thalassae]|uniref:Uncharacterized protein n=1 Tax=Vibrio thalassae TaxID=1243014 RepID=A0A240EKK6_9VIBR|nr:hypothetical protein VTH8203_02400 [Vibrio thalassae]